jgi:GAF domain-containing protein
MSSEKPAFNLLINHVLRIVKSAMDKNKKLLKICKILNENVQYFNWVGFYIADPENRILNLGPFVGETTEHTSISFGSGICGQTAETKETFIVQDVSKERNYLSCSPTVKSEIVVPIMKGDKFVAELDIDSHEIEPFADEDKKFLENVAQIVAQLF